MNSRLIAGLFAVLALFFSACSNTPAPPGAHKPSASPAPASTSPSETEDAIAQAEIDATKDAAFQYYVSPERRALLQEVLDTAGMKLARDMIAGRIPAEPEVWQKGDSRKPINEYGLLESLTYDSNYAASVVVKFVGGRVDLTAGVLNIDITRGGVVYSLNGRYVLDDQSQPIENTADCYGWSRRSGPNTDTNLHIAYRNDGRLADGLEPLDPNSGLYEVHGFGRPDYRVPVSVEEIKQKDAEFINQIKSLV